MNGRVIAAVKTSLGDTPATGTVNPDDPLVVLLDRSASGQWTSATFGKVADFHTRPIVLIDEEHGILHMLATAPETNGQIYRKSCPLSDIRFTGGRGTSFIESSLDPKIGDATSTKQNLNGSTGLAVVASDTSTHRYLHNTTPLSSEFFNTITPEADAYVRNGTFATTNFGASTVLETRTTDLADSQRDAYMRFDLTGVTGTPLAALLRVEATTGSGAPVNLGAYEVADIGWVETSINWNNRPPLGSLLSSTAVTGTTNLFYDYDVSSHVLAQLTAAADLVSFGLHNPLASATQVKILSRERAPVERPRLEIKSRASSAIPVAPTDLTAKLQSGTIGLSWIDNSTNRVILRIGASG